MTHREWTEEEVIDAFLLEDPADRRTLAAFLQRYPQHAEALLDVAHEIAFIEVSQGAPPAADEDELIARGWDRLEAGSGRVVAAADWTRDVLSRMQAAFNVPMPIFTALRDRRFRLDSVPSRILEVLATCLNTTREAVEAYLGKPAGLTRSASYKSSTGPQAPTEKLDFAKFVRDLGLSEDEQRRLLDGTD